MIGRLIDINSVNAQIAISSTLPFVEIKNEYPKTEISRQKGSLDINSQNIRCVIDSSECRAALGQKSIGEVVRESAENGMESVQEFIGDTAQQGDMLADIAGGGDALAEIAVEKSEPEAIPEAPVIPAPKSLISWVPNSLSIDCTPDDISISADTAKPSYNFIRGKVSVDLVRRAYVNINYIGRPNYIGGAGSLDTRA